MASSMNGDPQQRRGGFQTVATLVITLCVLAPVAALPMGFGANSMSVMCEKGYDVSNTGKEFKINLGHDRHSAYVYTHPDIYFIRFVATGTDGDAACDNLQRIIGADQFNCRRSEQYNRKEMVVISPTGTMVDRLKNMLSDSGITSVNVMHSHVKYEDRSWENTYPDRGLDLLGAKSQSDCTKAADGINAAIQKGHVAAATPKPIHHTGVCYEAFTPNFPGCSGYEKVGYTCAGDYCAATNPSGTPAMCAKQMPSGTYPDPRTGRCIVGGVTGNTQHGCTCRPRWEVGDGSCQDGDAVYAGCSMNPPCDGDSNGNEWPTWCITTEDCAGNGGKNWDYCN